MAYVELKDNEGFHQLLKRFKRRVDKSGIIKDVKKNEHYDKPSTARKKKSIKAQQRRAKLERRQSH